MKTSGKLWVRTFRDDLEVGDPVAVDGSPMMSMIRVLTDRTFDPTPGAVVPNYVLVEENMRPNEFGGRVKLMLVTGYLANHVGDCFTNQGFPPPEDRAEG